MSVMARRVWGWAMLGLGVICLVGAVSWRPDDDADDMLRVSLREVGIEYLDLFGRELDAVAAAEVSQTRLEERFPLFVLQELVAPTPEFIEARDAYVEWLADPQPTSMAALGESWEQVARVERAALAESRRVFDRAEWLGYILPLVLVPVGGAAAAFGVWILRRGNAPSPPGLRVVASIATVVAALSMWWGLDASRLPSVYTPWREHRVGTWPATAAVVVAACAVVDLVRYQRRRTRVESLRRVGAGACPPIAEPARPDSPMRVFAFDALLACAVALFVAAMARGLVREWVPARSVSDEELTFVLLAASAVVGLGAWQVWAGLTTRRSLASLRRTAFTLVASLFVMAVAGSIGSFGW